MAVLGGGQIAKNVMAAKSVWGLAFELFFDLQDSY